MTDIYAEAINSGITPRKAVNQGEGLQNDAMIAQQFGPSVKGVIRGEVNRTSQHFNPMP